MPYATPGNSATAGPAAISPDARLGVGRRPLRHSSPGDGVHCRQHVMHRTAWGGLFRQATARTHYHLGLAHHPDRTTAAGAMSGRTFLYPLGKECRWPATADT